MFLAIGISITFLSQRRSDTITCAFGWFCIQTTRRHIWSWKCVLHVFERLDFKTFMSKALILKGLILKGLISRAMIRNSVILKVLILAALYGPRLCFSGHWKMLCFWASLEDWTWVSYKSASKMHAPMYVYIRICVCIRIELQVNIHMYAVIYTTLKHILPRSNLKVHSPQGPT